MTVEELQVVITANTQGVAKQVNKAKGTIENMGRSAKTQTSAMNGAFGKVAGVVAGVGLAVGAAVVGMGVKAVSFTEDFHKALNGLQGQTGATDEEMKGFKDTMTNIYNANYGESFDEIGKAMAEVKTQTGLSGKALEDMTKKAFILKDTFGFEIKESVTSANSMMKQFGISGDEAYELITQGAQSGIDKNGDMLDTINEYSGSFKGAGFSATEMMNMLSNGAKSGAFSVDKLGDSMKEFGIRSKDGSKATSDAFTSLGLDAKATGDAFSQGGEKGKQAFKAVNDKLLSLKDPMEQNRLGVQLYGTQWEDLGVKGIGALTDINGTIDTSKNKLGELANVKYDTFGEALAGIGRNIETSLLIPIGEFLLPYLQRFADWIIANMPIIKEKMGNAFARIKDAIQKAWEYIKPSFDDLVKVIKENVVPMFESMRDVIKKAMPTIKTIIGIAMTIIVIAIKLVIAIVVKVIKVISSIWKFIKPAIDKLVEIIAKAVENIVKTFNFLTKDVPRIFQEVVQSAKDKFNAVKDAIMKPINKAVSLVSKAVEKVKGFFSGLSFKFPSIKLPKLPTPHIRGSFSLTPPSVPKLSWYAKGGVFNSPTTIGVGENGSEAVMPLQNNTGWIDTLASKLNGMGDSSNDRPLVIALEVSGSEFGRVAINSINQITKQEGRLALNI